VTVRSIEESVSLIEEPAERRACREMLLSFRQRARPGAVTFGQVADALEATPEDRRRVFLSQWFGGPIPDRAGAFRAGERPQTRLWSSSRVARWCP
jgi:hypothetical protein